MNDGEINPDLDRAQRIGLAEAVFSASKSAGQLPSGTTEIAVVTAGTSDVPVALEATRTLRFYGHEALAINDVGVAGIWRLFERLDSLKKMSVIIVAAGMDGALPSVIAGLVGGCVIAVPTSVGYGVADGGKTALNAALASCAPGLVVVNIDNGYGAACAALRIVRRNSAPAVRLSLNGVANDRECATQDQ
jgi:NCAIR mutase (PurE)-related protein